MYENVRPGDRGLMRGEVDYDEADEYANLDLDDLEELGLVMAPIATSPTATRTATRTAIRTAAPTSPITMLRTRLQTAAPTRVMAPVAPSPTSRCPSGEIYDQIEQMCVLAPTTSILSRFKLAVAPTAAVMAPIKPRDAPTSVSTHPSVPPDSVRVADVLVAQPLPPTSPRFSVRVGAPSVRVSAPSGRIAVPTRRFAEPTLLRMPEPPPTGAKVVGLSRNAKIGLGVGVGAGALLLIYMMTRK